MDNFRWGRISFNEGGCPVNFTVMWGKWCALFVYVYAFGHRWTRTWGRKNG